MSFQRKGNPIMSLYSFNNQNLERVFSIKDLGVTFQPDLTNFNLHINNVKSKALKILGFVNRKSKDFENPKTFIFLY